MLKKVKRKSLRNGTKSEHRCQSDIEPEQTVFTFQDQVNMQDGSLFFANTTIF